MLWALIKCDNTGRDCCLVPLCHSGFAEFRWQTPISQVSILSQQELKGEEPQSCRLLASLTTASCSVHPLNIAQHLDMIRPFTVYSWGIHHQICKSLHLTHSSVCVCDTCLWVCAFPRDVFLLLMGCELMHTHCIHLCLPLLQYVPTQTLALMDA